MNEGEIGNLSEISSNFFRHQNYPDDFVSEEFRGNLDVAFQDEILSVYDDSLSSNNTRQLRCEDVLLG